MAFRLEACTGTLVSVQHAGTDQAIVVLARTPLDEWPYGYDWETFTEERQPDGAVALKCQGRYLTALPSGQVEWNREVVDAWEKWIPHRSGRKVTYESQAHGSYLYVDLLAEPHDETTDDGEILWTGYPLALRHPQEWTFTVHPIAGSSDAGIVDERPRRGLVTRGSGRMFADEHGEWYPYGGVLMNLLYWWRKDRTHAHRQLATLNEELADYVRIFTSVYWGDLSVDPQWPDYEATFIDCVECCYHDYGLRIHLSVFAGADPWFGTDAAKYEAHCDRIGRLVAGREAMFLDKEAVNEASVTGIPDMQLMERIARAVNTRIPLALSGATSDMPTPHTDRGKPQQVAESLAWGCTTGIAQMGRYGTADGWDEALMPPWQWRRFPVPIHHNEPVGPGASSHAEYDPVRLATLRATGILCGVGAFVLHNAAGISGVATPGDATHPSVPANLDEMAHIVAINAACRGVDRFLPAHGTDGSLVNCTLEGSMLYASPCWRTSNQYAGGCYAAYASVREPDFWAVIGGIAGSVQIRSARAGELAAYDLVGGLVLETTMQAGEVLTLSPTTLDAGGRGTIILRGSFSDASPMPPTPTTTDAWHAWLNDVRARFNLVYPDQRSQQIIDGQACFYGAEVQTDSGGSYRGRLYLPSPVPTNPYACPVDFAHDETTWTWVVRF